MPKIIKHKNMHPTITQVITSVAYLNINIKNIVTPVDIKIQYNITINDLFKVIYNYAIFVN